MSLNKGGGQSRYRLADPVHDGLGRQPEVDVLVEGGPALGGEPFTKGDERAKVDEGLSRANAVGERDVVLILRGQFRHMACARSRISWCRSSRPFSDSTSTWTPS